MSKNECGGCNKPVVGKALSALNRSWHPEHFVCGGCKEPMVGKRFYESQGKPFCEPCHANLFSPKCAGCNQAVTGRCLTAMNQSWHPEHFVCTTCKKAFDEKTGFHEQNNKPFCGNCYSQSFGSMCAGCNSIISDQYLTALDKEWHLNCFVCHDCRRPFEAGNFFEENGVPVCEIDYHKRQGSLCFTCQKPITGKCIGAMDRKFHPDHFTCAECQADLSMEFHEMQDKAYCANCFAKASASAF